jgi:uncharacterized protein YggU (UPF0235/DUF167 family)
MVAVEGYLKHDNYKFLKETVEVPSFSIDLLKSVKATLKTLKLDGIRGQSITCKDPLLVGRKRGLNRNEYFKAA